MLVKEIIQQALILVGREDMTATIGSSSQTTEQQQVERAMLLCYNAVEDELARTTIPLKATALLIPVNGKIAFSDFGRYPIRLYSVRCNGVTVSYRVTANGIEVEGTGVHTIDYGYAPSAKAIGDKSEYEEKVGASLLTYGTASEFCLVTGRSEEADAFDGRYRRSLENMTAFQDGLKAEEDDYQTTETTETALPNGGTIKRRSFV